MWLILNTVVLDVDDISTILPNHSDKEGLLEIQVQVKSNPSGGVIIHNVSEEEYLRETKHVKEVLDFQAYHKGRA